MFFRSKNLQVLRCNMMATIDLKEALNKKTFDDAK